MGIPNRPRASSVARPSDRPDSLPLFRGTRPLKRWRYVGVFGEQFMICAASIQVGPARQTFWAVFERESALKSTPSGAPPEGPTLWGASRQASGAMTERTRMIPRRGALDLTAGRLRIRDDAVLLDLHYRKTTASKQSAQTATHMCGRASKLAYALTANWLSAPARRSRSTRLP